MSSPAGVVDDLLAGRYRLTSRLAAGGMGEVWRARDLLLDRDVAVKTLRPELADDEDLRTRFRGEARSAARLSHPGIASVYDFGEAGGRAWLVLELVEGESLAATLRRDGRLTADRTLCVVSQTATALQAAHAAGVVHRDVKPGNLLVGPDGRIKVTDFGIAAAAGSAQVTRTGQVVGTAAYLSPEQAGGKGASEATDLYALGVVAYECLAGRRPFDFDEPMAVLLAHLQTPPPPLPDDVPAPVADTVLRLLAKDPADRPGSARQVAAEADALRRRLPALPASPAPAPPAPAPPAPAPPAGATPVGSRPTPVLGQVGAVGLSGRSGQRRAVRATALLLGLLALALGVRESLSDPTAPVTGQAPPATSPARSAAPAPSASAPAAEGPGAAVPGEGAAPSPGVPAPPEQRDGAVPPAGPPQEAAPQQERAAQQRQQEAAQRRQDAAEEQQEVAEEQQEVAEQRQEDAEDAREQDGDHGGKGNGGDSGNSGKSGQGNGGGGGKGKGRD